MSPSPGLALDTGGLVTRVALARPGGKPRISCYPFRPDEQAAVLLKALRTEAREGGGYACIAIPDSWLDGEIAGARAHELLRAAIERDQDHGRISWVGQLSAVAACAADQAGPSAQGLCLVCDLGGTGIRAGAFMIDGTTVHQVGTDTAPGGGAASFDAAIRAGLGGASMPPPEQWFDLAASQHERAEVLLRQAKASKAFHKAIVYKHEGLPAAISAGLLLDSFEPSAHRLESAIGGLLAQTARALCDPAPALTVLAGGLAWFPPVTELVTGLAKAPVANLGVEAAVRGALAIATGRVKILPASLPDLSLPAHEIRGGLLAETRLPLPWPSADGDGIVELTLHDQDLVVDVAGRLRAVRFPDLVPGAYRIRVRPGGRGRALLVLHPDYGPGQTVLISPLDLE